ncbi:hypothetical protein BUALT_BualtUnG0050300 [Buddleja alternifolia]|uniref:SWIM-type domain-containing protein n=1 Tax=Buddleja alternifolia TaxID=168488 RepID=A0AAV6W3I2_9LAMI|nr:hypothetical protein BUALT_BualtUnG0050300 [Buddleja alternifolia]
MVLLDYADFYVWSGGSIEWLPTVKYFSGSKMLFPDVDKERFYYSDLVDMYSKAGNKCSTVNMYYCLPGHSLDHGIRILHVDKGVIELIRAYKGMKAGVSEGVQDRVGESVDTGVNKGIDAGGNEGVQAGQNEGVEEDPTYEYNENESESDSGSVSDCPTWIFEAFEAQQQEELNIQRGVHPDGWYSDVDNEDELQSLRGSDDDSEVHQVWNDQMEKIGVDLFIGLKFIRRNKYKEVLKDGVVKKGWDIRFLKCERGRVTAVYRFEVQQNLDNHIVYLNERHCSCGMFQLVGYPCCHTLVCIVQMRFEVEDYVDPYLKNDIYLRVYRHMINPVPGMNDYEESTLGVVDPPNVVRRAGSPRKVRIRDGNDIRGQTNVSRKALTHTCTIYGEQGHNKAGHNKYTRQTEVPPEAATEDVPPPSQQKNAAYATEDSQVPPPLPTKASHSVSHSRKRAASQMPPQPAQPRTRQLAWRPIGTSTSTHMPCVASQTREKQTASQPFVTSTQVPTQSSQGPTFSVQPNQNSSLGQPIPTQSEHSQIPQQVPRQSPRSRKQANPVSLSSRKLRKMKLVLKPTPNLTYKKPSTASSILRAISASYRPRGTSGPSLSSVPTTTSSSMPRGTFASSKPTPENSKAA